uniref:Uncharacterized protein n=1 Tax=Pyrodinium bahamense TaxID=73915 RepID=A0A7S0AU40_9DINO|mmetsp:Transcript_41558/g.115601  ORF Transcript_41558/g.115601 Transcript_41558/m.115601 type:complete len:587 (+) Transcript_41558:46-1806(+)
MADVHAEATAYLAKGRSGNALLVATQELARAKKAGDHKLQADAAVMIAEIYLSRGQPEMAIRSVKDALLASKFAEDKKTEASVLQTVTSAFLMVSAGEQALRAATQLEALADGLGDAAGRADAHALAAQALLTQGDAQGALAKAQEAAELHRSAGARRGLAAALQTLAEVQLCLRDGDGALKAAEDGAALFKELGERPGQASALNAAAGARQLRGEAAEGLCAAREALLLFRQAGDRRGEAVARATCACLRPQPEARVPPKPVERLTASCIPGATGVATANDKGEPWVSATRVMGSAEAKHLVGSVAIVTGASRGIGKGISTILAEAGAVVYVTGRSAPGKITDPHLKGTVNETAALFPKIGGVGVALHMDHTQKAQNEALAGLILDNHGRVDVLVNNAFALPTPDENFYSTALWQQPLRYLNEQVAVGGFNHVALTLRLLPCLRRGRGLVVNVSSAGSQQNAASLPASYLCSKAALDRTMSALSERVRHCGVYVLTLWPGCVRTERNKAAAQRACYAKLVDTETARFSGLAVRGLAGLQPTELARLASARRTLACADVVRYDVDGYLHEGDLRTFTVAGRVPLAG